MCSASRFPEAVALAGGAPLNTPYAAGATFFRVLGERVGIDKPNSRL
jgi:hypothetical protein